MSWIWALSFFKSSVYQDALRSLLEASGRAWPPRRAANEGDTDEKAGSIQSSDRTEDIAVDALVAFGLQDQLTKGDVSTEVTNSRFRFYFLRYSFLSVLFSSLDGQSLVCFELERQATHESAACSLDSRLRSSIGLATRRLLVLLTLYYLS